MIVKRSITRFAAAQVHPEEAREMIYAGAETAVRRLGSVPLPDIELPARLDVEFQTADMAHVASWVKGVEQAGTATVRISGDDPLEVYRSFVGITYITRVSEGTVTSARGRHLAGLLAGDLMLSVAALAGTDRLEAAALRLVEGHVAAQPGWRRR